MQRLPEKDHVSRAFSVSALWAAMAAAASLPSAVARAQPDSVSTENNAVAQEVFICRLPGASDRVVGIYRAADGAQRCRVDYMRDGKTRSLWNAGHDYAYCVRKALEIVGLLEQVHFQCSPQTRGDSPAAD
jgi:hypothetical protein